MSPRRSGRKPKGNKRVSYQLIDDESTAGQPIYKLMKELIASHHSELKDARIALAWCTSWKPDRDGRVTLGKCTKATDLHRELAPFDFIILLKKSFWEDESTQQVQRVALLDHELCHAAVSFDDRTGEPVYDERGRKVYRTRKHDIEEFEEIGERYGCWKRDIERFYAAVNRSAREKFQSCGECSSEGWRSIEGKAVRCPCWVRWSNRHLEAQAVSA
jgi:hypothetical protein